MIDESVPKAQDKDVKELRLALVCYGGVSLAIYMHGITKEIHRLVRASEAFNGNPNVTVQDLDPGEKVYLRALEACERVDDVKTRVVVDVIAGTSAGGINGICLAKALAQNRDLRALKDLWIDNGDIAGLVKGSVLPWKLRAAFQLFRNDPVLKGDQMSRWLYEAFEKMDESRGKGSLLPDDLALELFVPVTDFHGYERQFPIDSPLFVRDRTHRHVMAFRQVGAQGQFTSEYNHALAFAARATSSFPGAFDPITFESYGAAVGKGANSDLGGRANDFFSVYKLNKAYCDKAHFVDGGVLNNYPFGSAIDAIQRKPAATEVERRLIYIEPDPKFSDGRISGMSGKAAEPGLIKTALGAVAGIPGNQPIIDELARLAERNRVVRRVRDVIETSFERIKARIDALLKARNVDLVALLGPDGERIAELGEVIEEEAEKDAGLNFATYARLRMATLTDGYAGLIAEALRFPAGSYHAAFVAGVLREWAMPSETPDQGDDATDDAQEIEARTSEIERKLAALDLGYHERRLRFVIAAFSWWYRDTPDVVNRPPRRQLDQAKSLVYHAILRIQNLARGLADEPEGRALLAVFDSAAIDGAIDARETFAGYVRKNRDALEKLKALLAKRIRDENTGVAAIETAMYRELVALAAGWGDEAKKNVLVRYLGFPYWDILVYPIQALANVGERDHVSVARFSPRDANMLEPLDAKEGKLKGVQLAHFGAFLKRDHRENDYLWGRLDAAELLLDLLARSTPETGGREPHETNESLKVEALEALLDQESSLASCGEVIAHARKQLKPRKQRLQMNVVSVRQPVGEKTS